MLNSYFPHYYSQQYEIFHGYTLEINFILSYSISWLEKAMYESKKNLRIYFKMSILVSLCFGISTTENVLKPVDKWFIYYGKLNELL